MTDDRSDPDATPDTTASASTDGTGSADAGDRDRGRTNPRVFRRIALTSLLGLGGLAASGGLAAGQGQGTRQWRTDIDANGNVLFDLGGLETVPGSERQTAARSKGLPAMRGFCGSSRRTLAR